MAGILFSERFANLTAWTLQEGAAGTVSIVSGYCLLDQVDTPGGWNTLGLRTTNAMATSASGHVVYGQLWMETVATADHVIIALNKSGAINDPYADTVSLQCGSGEIHMYDAGTGNIGAYAVADATWYDWKMTFESDEKVKLYVRVSTSAGNLPASTGAWTLVATSARTDMLGDTIYLVPKLNTSNGPADYRIDEIYYSDGTYAPPDPTSPVATTQSSTSIKIDWTDAGNSGNETGFKVERSATGGGAGFAVVQTVNQSTVTWTDTGLSHGTAYFYRVRAYFTFDGTDYFSGYTSEVTATTTLPAPDTLAATAVSATQINLTWADNSTGEDGFKIERSTASGSGFSQIDTAAANATSYSDTSVPLANTTFYYRVRAYKGAVNSSYSSEASATTLPKGGGGTTRKLIALGKF